MYFSYVLQVSKNFRVPSNEALFRRVFISSLILTTIVDKRLECMQPQISITFNNIYWVDLIRSPVIILESSKGIPHHCICFINVDCILYMHIRIYLSIGLSYKLDYFYDCLVDSLLSFRALLLRQAITSVLSK